jgi:lipopolysaccharide/colanic/teichoic acid biosynthesis glycosyltransferase
MLVALVGMALFAPPMLAVAFLVKLDSAIYKQPRAGTDRRLSRGPDFENHRRSDDRGFRI